MRFLLSDYAVKEFVYLGNFYLFELFEHVFEFIKFLQISSLIKRFSIIYDL